MRLSRRLRALLLSIWGVSFLSGVTVIFLHRPIYLLSSQSKLVMLLGTLTGGALILVSIRLLLGRGPKEQPRTIAAIGVILGVTLLLGAPLTYTPWVYEGGMASGISTGATVILWMLAGAVVWSSLYAYKQYTPRPVLILFALLAGLGWYFAFQLNPRLQTKYQLELTVLWVALVGGSLIVATQWPAGTKTQH